ncbi:hypothetical protein [Streptomyces sp. NPDC002994]|uniref:hypothetical protein n=1 Tax=Streptomyces sp. NPDC002994 TaxID=3154441 RepID=UPI0033B5A68B
MNEVMLRLEELLFLSSPEIAVVSAKEHGEVIRWIAAVRPDDLPSMHAFVNGRECDLDAVIAGLTLPWNSGIVEGHANRIKMIKRQMYGRAGFPLLRKRVLLV